MVHLEDLPDEIFVHDIFPWFPWQGLYHAFFGLNQRFNDMLRSTSHLKFTVQSDNADAPPSLMFFAPCIRSLEVWLGQFDVEPFSGPIRSLILHYPSLRQRNAIRLANFPYLEHLNLAYPLEDTELLRVIFSNAFPHLKKCRFDRTLVDPSWPGSSTLCSLAISINLAQDAIVVLRVCPNLRRLHIIIYETWDDDVSLPPQPIPGVRLLSLRYLFVRSAFPQLPAILLSTPNLQSLTYDDIASYRSVPYSTFSFAILANLLSNLPLRYLHFAIGRSNWDHRTNLNTLHPLFRYVRCKESNPIVVTSYMD